MSVSKHKEADWEQPIDVQQVEPDLKLPDEHVLLEAVSDKIEEEHKQQEDMLKAEAIRAQLASDKQSNNDEYPEDPEIRAEKEQYINDTLDPLFKHNINDGNLLPEHFQKLIDLHSKGKDSKQQQIRFEATMDYCILNGRANAETVMWNIIQGVAEGIISYSHMSYYLEKYANQFPVLEYFYKLNSQKDYVSLVKQFKGRNNFKKFVEFYWTVVMVDSDVQQRIQKSAPERKWDHDLYADFAPGGNAMTAKNIDSETAIENSYVGILALLRANRKVLSKHSNKFTSVIASFLTLNSRLRGRNIGGNIARRSDLIGGEKTIDKIDAEIWKLIRPMEPDLFNLLKNPNVDLGRLQKYLNYKYEIHIESVEDFYDNLDGFIDRILSVPKKGLLAKILH